MVTTEMEVSTEENENLEMSNTAYKSRVSYPREGDVESEKINVAYNEMVKGISGRKNDICRGMEK